MLGIAFGLWWTDSAAAALISIEIIKDGVEDLRNSIAQLMNKRPTDMEGKEPDPTPDATARAGAAQLGRGRACAVTGDGDVLPGEAFIIPRDERDLCCFASKRPNASRTASGGGSTT